MWKTLALVLLIATPTAAYADNKQQSEEIAQQAYEAYSKGDFQQALALYKKAYQTAPVGVILFNIANIYDKKLKDHDQAAEYYHRYLRSGDTEAELVRRATDRLDVIRAEKDAAKQQTPPAAPPATKGSEPPKTEPQQQTPPAAPEDRGATLRAAGLITGAAGLVGIGIGSVFGLTAKSKNDDAASKCNGNACTDPSALTLTEDARSAAQASTFSFIAGGALLASGIIMFALAPRAEKRASVRIAPQVGGLTVWGTWQ